MTLNLYQVDAFTSTIFGGNPAAVCLLDTWLDDSIMQQIAQENNLAETAFVVSEGDGYAIRWFTPEIEVALCGHATLAAAFVIFDQKPGSFNTVRFNSVQSGPLQVEKSASGLLTLDFPADVITQIEHDTAITEAIGLIPKQTFKGKTDYLLIYGSQENIEQIRPNFHLLHQLNCRGVIVSAPGDKVDFVSRFFAPQCGVPEDPVTGSAHTTLIPFWSKKLGKVKMKAQQLSKRGGDLGCEYLGDRVKISGDAVLYMKAEINI